MSWYAIFVKTGKEDELCLYIKHIFEKSKVQFQLLVPKRELVEYYEGVKRLVKRTMFPGYILLNTDSIEQIYAFLSSRWHSNIYAMLKSGGFFQEIPAAEIVPIINLINKDGTITSSSLFLENDKVIVKEGPLLNYTGLIRKINARKGRAKIILNFLGRECKIDIPIKCLRLIKE